MHPLRDMSQGKFGLSGLVRSELFDTDIGVDIEAGGNVKYGQKCADHLNSLPASIVDHLCEASIRYCNSFLDDIGEPLREFANSRDVLDIIYPSTLIVPVLPADREPLIHMELNCDWEEEHGLEWIIRDGKVCYVGPFYGTNPEDDFTEKDSWNYA